SADRRGRPRRRRPTAPPLKQWPASLEVFPPPPARRRGEESARERPASSPCFQIALFRRQVARLCVQEVAMRIPSARHPISRSGAPSHPGTKDGRHDGIVI